MARAKKVNYNEDDLIDLFSLTRVADRQTPEMQRWLTVQTPVLDIVEQGIFDRILPFAIRDMAGWCEEELKMHFISQILPTAHLTGNGRYKAFYEKTISGVVDGIELSTKTDFMLATSAFIKPKSPYFHFQEYKPLKPSLYGGIRRGLGDSMAQLLEAMLIAQEKNKNGKPIYGCEIVGKEWSFVTLKDKTYCISEALNSVKKDRLLSIIAILRHFKHILETELLDDI